MGEGTGSLTRELARIDDEFRRAYDGDCRHGLPLRQVSSGITAEAAAARHAQLGHSIGALVSHVAAWVEVATRRIAEWRAIETPDAGDFPPVPDTTEEALAAALEGLDRRRGKHCPCDGRGLARPARRRRGRALRGAHGPAPPGHRARSPHRRARGLGRVRRPEWRDEVRRRKEEEHHRYLDWYLGRWG